jgi:predicted dehydrogenase
MLVGETRTIRAWDTLGEKDADPSIDVDLLAGRDVPVTLLALPRDTYDVMELDLFGDRGRISIKEFGSSISLYATASISHLPEYRKLVKTERWQGPPIEAALTASVEDIARCMDQGGTPLCDGADGLAALEIVEDALSKARESGH